MLFSLVYLSLTRVYWFFGSGILGSHILSASFLDSAVLDGHHFRTGRRKVERFPLKQFLINGSLAHRVEQCRLVGRLCVLDTAKFAVGIAEQLIVSRRESRRILSLEQIDHFLGFALVEQDTGKASARNMFDRFIAIARK
jgi:hypothetical protein